jgi:hypothetical protein
MWPVRQDVVSWRSFWVDIHIVTYWQGLTSHLPCTIYTEVSVLSTAYQRAFVHKFSAWHRSVLKAFPTVQVMEVCYQEEAQI